MFNLKEYYLSLNHVKNDDGTITILEDVKINDQNLSTLQCGIIISEIKGNFECFNNKLENLLDSPKIVKGHFFAYWNKLTSTEGSPDKVYHNYSISSNQIIHFIKSPKYIGGDFYCYDNKLQNLINSPETVKGVYDIQNNNLVNLTGITADIGKDLVYLGNQISDKDIQAFYDFSIDINPLFFSKYKKYLNVALMEKYDYLNNAEKFMLFFNPK